MEHVHATQVWGRSPMGCMFYRIHVAWAASLLATRPGGSAFDML